MSLFVYDSTISFSWEWWAIRSRKITGATALYLALHYVILVNVIVYIIYLTMPSCESNAMRSPAFASIRVYAIDGCRWTKATIVMMLGLVPIAINICFLSPGYASSCQISWSSSQVSTWQATRTNRSVTAWSSRGSLMTVLFRDGIVHFALVIGLNAADVVAALLLGELLDISSTVEFLKMSTHRISTVVLCRFFLNLRHFSKSPNINDSTTSSHQSSFSSFASRIIGNLGEMLEDDPQAFDDDLDFCNPEADEESAADREAPPATDEGFEQRTIDIV
ncbi:predicted protein [Postia placenta Mad-698-R]|nr:predicted protein [Postia placenta Mad-698-R]